MTHTFIPQGVCSRAIEFDIDNEGIITDVRFIGGCSGNTQGVAMLARGMKAADVAEKLKNINCGGKGTSCPAQLAKALTEALAQD